MSRFELLIAEISTSFINVPIERTTDAITDAQCRIGELLGVNHFVRWQILERKSGKDLLSHFDRSAADRLQDSPFETGENFPWILKRILRGQIVKITRLEDFPQKGDRDRRSLLQMGVHSAIVLPLLIEGQVVGALLFGRLRKEGGWQERIVNRLQLVAQMFANVLARKLASDVVESFLQFETLLAEISTRFINLPIDRIDGEIEEIQRRICECLGFDISVLWQWSDENQRLLILTHLHSPPEGPTRPNRLDARESFPWSLEQLLQGKRVAFNTEALPPEAAKDQESNRHYGIKSSVAIPLSAGGGPIIGVVTFHCLKTEWSWSEPILRRLDLVAQIFANALFRKWGELELRESESRLNMATNAGKVGLWIMVIGTGNIWITPNTRVLFHFDSVEPLNEESFSRAVHTEDRERVRDAMRMSIKSGQDLWIEFRIVHPDGSARWVNASGQRLAGSVGRPDRLMGILIDITERKQVELELQKRMEEIEGLKQELEKENVYLREEIELQSVHEEIIGRSPAMMKMLTKLEHVARTDATVLIEGETGTGKELLARAVHRLSSCKDRPLVTVNCASLPPTLIESELFGREKGAYTGALTRMTGRFEAAQGATLFLDEIGELQMDVQTKLLRVLEQGCFERLGSSRTLQVDVRIIAATNRKLSREVAAGRFRKDLFYRLNVFPIFVPPLRERPEDIPPLVWTFIREYEKRMGRRVDRVSRKSMDDLQRYAWPGNVRELRNVIERAMIVSSGRTLEIRIPQDEFAESPSSLNLEEADRNLILKVLQQTGWRISGEGGASAVLGIKRTTLLSKMKKLGIRRLPL